MLLVDSLRVYVENMNMAVINFCKTETNKKSFNKRNIWFIKSKELRQQWLLKQLKELYSLTWELSELINTRMSRTILATITANFIELTINLYWVYAYLHVRTLVLESWYYPIPRLTLLITLFYSCENCWCHIRQTHQCIHQITRYKSALINNITLKRFCLQVNYSPIVLTANDFFNIDYQTLNAVSTYRNCNDSLL